MDHRPRDARPISLHADLDVARDGLNRENNLACGRFSLGSTESSAKS
jgi:hypothetical protein